ncbi:hypothetical protein IMSHALPRED_009448 [Imshaugia aleurites]|uniref:ER membrane protein complex subunit 7 beta-sandwich domain-containing protein n=1 Tax=Imshaugia aleurites TaxID=172621 RepID=A0A8H3IU60_9LECA|nr:hypothetical protein IMSHALPRED_009448 [Imshaugia aleurites]
MPPLPTLLPLLLFLSLLSLPTALTTTTPPSPPSPLHTATLYHLPSTPSPTPSTPHPLAILTYSPQTLHLSVLKSFTPPPNTSDTHALTSVAVYPNNGVGGHRYSSSVTATYAFHAPCKGRFRVVLDANGDVVGASWRAYLLKGEGKGEGESESESERGDFDILTTKPAPAVVFDKPVKGKGGAAGAGAGMAGSEGEEEVVEKTLLQK